MTTQISPSSLGETQEYSEPHSHPQPAQPPSDNQPLSDNQPPSDNQQLDNQQLDNQQPNSQPQTDKHQSETQSDIQPDTQHQLDNNQPNTQTDTQIDTQPQPQPVIQRQTEVDTQSNPQIDIQSNPHSDNQTPQPDTQPDFQLQKQDDTQRDQPHSDVQNEDSQNVTLQSNIQIEAQGESNGIGGAPTQVQSDDSSSSPIISTNGTNAFDMSIHEAASKGDKDALLHILSNSSVDINLQNDDGFTALAIAARNGNARCVKLLLKNGAKSNIKDTANSLPIHLAVLGDHRKSTQQLVEVGGARVNRRNGEGYTPLHLAVLFSYEKMVKLLLDKGARVDKMTLGRSPRHPLHLAATKGNTAIMRQLLAAKPTQLNPLDDQGRTPLFLAVENDFPEIVAALVMHGAAVSIPSKSGESPLALAIKRGYEDICHTLCTNGADVSLRYSLPYTPHRTRTMAESTTVTHTDMSTMVPSTVDVTTNQDDNTSVGSAMSDSDDVPLDLVMQVDRYGHVNKSNSPDNPNPRASKLLKIEMRRAKKWSHMIKQWNIFTTKKSEKLHERVAKGIPDCVRGVVWKLLAGEAEDVQWVENEVTAGKERYQRLQVEQSKWTTQIDLDVNRAARNHLMFRERYGKGQRALFNILKAYSSHDTEVGYCQGMSDITALLLKYVTEDEGFWMLERIMNAPKWRMRDLFLPGFPRLRQAFYIHDALLSLYCPALSNHLIKENVLAPFYATKWYLMAFLDIFPFEVTLRLWDLLFAEGYTIVYSIGVGVMRMYEAEFLGRSFDKMMAFFRGLETMPLNVDKFIAHIVKNRIPMRKILFLEEEYNKNFVQ